MANESGLNFISVKGPELLNMVSCVCSTSFLLIEFLKEMRKILSRVGNLDNNVMNMHFKVIRLIACLPGREMLGWNLIIKLLPNFINFYMKMQPEKKYK